MLGNVYVNKIYARQVLYELRLYWRGGFSHAFNFFAVSKGIFQNSREKRFFNGATFN